MENMSLLIVLAAALVIPLTLARWHITKLPTAVAEIIVGMVLGKSLLGFVHVNTTLNSLSELGVTVLIFLSGMEIDFSLFKPQKNQPRTPKKIGIAPLAVLSFTSVVVVSFLYSWFLAAIGFYPTIAFTTILFSTIALGIVIAALKEKEILSQPLGQTLLLIAGLGEVLPLIALTVFSTLAGNGDKNLWPLLLILVAALLILLRFKRPYQWFVSVDKSTTQLDIRLAFFIIMILVTVASEVGAESILGAFVAGMVMKLLGPRQETQDKLTSLGYGFFIPIFFIITGAKLDLKTLLADPHSLTLIPLVLIGFFLAKVALLPILHWRFKWQNAFAGTTLMSTTITLVIPALSVGRNLNILTAQQSGAFTLAALLTCIIAPVVFNRFYVADPDEITKTRVSFIGANILTVPIAQNLPKDLYDVTLYTDKPENYKTYNSEANIKLVALTEAGLTESGAFDTDVMLLGYFDYHTNYDLAQLALSAHVPRIIARFENKDVLSDRYAQLEAAGVEMYNSLEANIALLHNLIETPTTMKILEDSTAGIYEVQVKNSRFAGMEIKNLPFINAITISQVYREGHFIQPHGDTQLYLGDRLIFSGARESLPEIRQQMEKSN